MTPTVSDLTAGRRVGSPDMLDLGWKAKTNSGSELRILFEVAGKWYVAEAVSASDSRSGNIDLSSDISATTLGGDSFTIDAANLEKAFEVKIQARQGSTGDWDIESNPVKVPAK